MQDVGHGSSCTQDQQQQQVQLNGLVEREGHQDKKDVYRHQDTGGLHVGKPIIDQQVVDVAPVGMKRRLAPKNARNKHPERVVKRNDHDADSYGRNSLDLVEVSRFQVIVHIDEPDDQNCTGGADDQGARVSHEYLGRGVVILQECDDGPHEGERDDGEFHAAHPEEPAPQHSRNERAHAAGQAVDAVDQVKGIDDDQNGEKGQPGVEGLRQL